MASALEVAETGGLDDVASQSFVALKALHLAKVKLLINSIDSLQQKLKEADKDSTLMEIVVIQNLTILDRESQRSAMIQNLRSKLKDQGKYY